jgi:hypothetical protein
MDTNKNDFSDIIFFSDFFENYELFQKEIVSI